MIAIGHNQNHFRSFLDEFLEIKFIYLFKLALNFINKKIFKPLLDINGEVPIGIVGLNVKSSSTDVVSSTKFKFYEDY
jgi:hypothetical protein